MKDIKSIWFKTDLALDDLAKKLDFEIEEFDYENVYEWVIATVNGVKIDIARNHTEKRKQTYTNIFRIEPHKAPFSNKLLNQIVLNLQEIQITPIYLGVFLVTNEDVFECKLVNVVE